MEETNSNYIVEICRIRDCMDILTKLNKFVCAIKSICNSSNYNVGMRKQDVMYILAQLSILYAQTILICNNSN